MSKMNRIVVPAAFETWRKTCIAQPGRGVRRRAAESPRAGENPRGAYRAGMETGASREGTGAAEAASSPPEPGAAHPPGGANGHREVEHAGVERTHRARRIREERQQRDREREAREPTRHRDRGGGAETSEMRSRERVGGVKLAKPQI